MWLAHAVPDLPSYRRNAALLLVHAILQHLLDFLSHGLILVFLLFRIVKGGLGLSVLNGGCLLVVGRRCWRAMRGVGLMLDDRARAGCGSATNAPPGHSRPAGADAGGDGEAAGRPATETGQEHTAPAGEPEAELLVAGRAVTVVARGQPGQ